MPTLTCLTLSRSARMHGGRVVMLGFKLTLNYNYFWQEPQLQFVYSLNINCVNIDCNFRSVKCSLLLLCFIWAVLSSMMNTPIWPRIVQLCNRLPLIWWNRACFLEFSSSGSTTSWILADAPLPLSQWPPTPIAYSQAVKHTWWPSDPSTWIWHPTISNQHHEIHAPTPMCCCTQMDGDCKNAHWQLAGILPRWSETWCLFGSVCCVVEGYWPMFLQRMI